MILIFFRVSQLLIGEELRRAIASKSGIVNERPPLGHTWPDIEFQYPPDEDFLLPSFDSDLPSLSIQLLEDESEDCRAEAVQEVIENIVQSIEKGNSALSSSLSADASFLPNNSGMNSSSDIAPPSGRISSDTSSKTLDSFLTHNGTVGVLNDDDKFCSCRAASERMQSSPKRSSENSTVFCESEEEFFSDDYEASFLSDEELKLFQERRRKKKKTFRNQKQNLPTISLDKADVLDSLNSTDVSPRNIGPGPEIVLQVKMTLYMSENCACFFFLLFMFCSYQSLQFRNCFQYLPCAKLLKLICVAGSFLKH